MLRLQKVLVPTDLSDYSLRVLPYAVALARLQQGRIVLAHVARSHDTAAARAVLETMGERLSHAPYEIVVETGDPVKGLVSLAARVQADLIVVATHGRTGLARVVLGSTAEGLMRHALCPVMVMRHPGSDFIDRLEPSAAAPGDGPPRLPALRRFAVLPMQQQPPTADEVRQVQRGGGEGSSHPERVPWCPLPADQVSVRLRRILVPVDFSARSRVTVDYAAELARACDATLDLFHVLDDPEAAEDVDPAQEEATRHARVMAVHRQLRSLGDALKGVPYGAAVSFGVPRDAIVGVAAEHEADLIVLGTQGRSGLARLVMGSTAEGVVRRAPCPVLTLRCPAPCGLDEEDVMLPADAALAEHLID